MLNFDLHVVKVRNNSLYAQKMHFQQFYDILYMKICTFISLEDYIDHLNSHVKGKGRFIYIYIYDIYDFIIGV